MLGTHISWRDTSTKKSIPEFCRLFPWKSILYWTLLLFIIQIKTQVLTSHNHYILFIMSRTIVNFLLNLIVKLFLNSNLYLSSGLYQWDSFYTFLLHCLGRKSLQPFIVLNSLIYFRLNVYLLAEINFEYNFTINFTMNFYTPKTTMEFVDSRVVDAHVCREKGFFLFILFEK